MGNLDDAIRYREEFNFSVIPVGKDKKPLFKWEPYQKEKASNEQIKQWWKKFPDANIGIVTGKISNLAVIDIDTDEGKEAILNYIPESLITPTVETPKSGQHLYFRCPDDKLSNNARLIPGCDLRANGGYVVAPPSVNGTGKPYRWIVDLKTSIAPLPDAYLQHVLNLYSYSYRETVTDSVTLFQQGRRDEDIFHIANQLAKAKTPENEIRQVLEILAKNCNPPFPEKEVNTKIESALKRTQRSDVNVTEMIERWVSVTDGDFSVTDALQAITTVTIRYKRYKTLQTGARLEWFSKN